MGTMPARRRRGTIITSAASAPKTTSTITPDVRHIRDGGLERRDRTANRARQHLGLLACAVWRKAGEPAEPARREEASWRLAGGGAGAWGTGFARFRLPVRLSRRLRRPARADRAPLARRLGLDRRNHRRFRGERKQPLQDRCRVQSARFGWRLSFLGTAPRVRHALPRPQASPPP